MNRHDYIRDILEALGDETLTTKRILPRLKVYRGTKRQLSGFMNSYMANSYAERIVYHENCGRYVKWRALAV